MRNHSTADKELSKLPREEREWILAWREGSETGEKYNASHGYGDEGPRATTSLDRPFAQVRRIDSTPPKPKKSSNNDFRFPGSFGDSLEKTELFFANEWKKIMDDCASWIEAMERCYIVLESTKEKNPKSIITQCQTRFSRKSKKITRWRMELFSQKVQKGGIREGLQITLSTDPKVFDDLREVGERWKFYLEKFMDFLGTRLRRAGKKNITFYLRACELTESGLLHVHIGLYGPGITRKIPIRKYNRHTRTYDTTRDYIFPQKDINALWRKYGIIRGIGSIGTWVNRSPVNEVADYVTKHVAKGWGGKSNEMLEAFLHYTGMRQWSSSKGAVPKAPPSVESWALRDIAFGPGEAVLCRLDLLAEGKKMLRDDTIEWENRQKDSGGYL